MWLILLSLVTRIFAYPAVGDFVRYEAEFEGAPVIMTKKVVAYYPDREAFLVGYRVTYKDRVLEEVAYDQPKTWLYTPEKVQNVLKTCVAREGAISIVEIQNEKLKVCEFYDEGSMLTYMIGPVPFGQVRFQIYLEGEAFLDFHLKEFIK